MKIVAAGVVLALSSPALADVAAELAAGTGGDTSSSAGFAAIETSGHAILDRAAAPIDRRGLSLGDPQGDGRLWMFTGIDPHDADSVGAEASAQAHAALDDSQRGAVASGRAWARGAGWQLTGRVALQPVGDLNDAFWRSGRGVVATGGAIEIPPMWALGTARHQFSTGVLSIELGHRSTDVDGAWTRSGWDRDIDYHGFRWQAPAYALDFIHVHYIEFGAASSTTNGTTYGTSAMRADLDVARTTIRLRWDLELAAHAGLAIAMPSTLYAQTGSSETSYGAVATEPSYGVELRERLDRTRTLSLGAGSWMRLDPSGHAGDAGQLATAALDWRLAIVRLRAGLEGGRLVRAVIGADAPMGLAPVGTTMWMGRATTTASVELAHATTITADAWIERSDRDDPRWSIPADGSLATHAGAELTVGWHYH